MTQKFFSQPIQIGKLQIANRVFLAPLAGVSDIPFRRICQEFGAGLTYVEMLSARAITYENKRTVDMRKRHESEEILGVQVTGPTPQELDAAIKQLNSENFDTIDINMGCPVKKVTKANCGSAIIKDSEYMANLVEVCRAATDKPLSIKVRLGFTDINIEKTAQHAVPKNIDMLTIHGRTAQQTYADKVNYKDLALGITTGRDLATQDIVLVGNGDIFDLESAYAMRNNTGCDAIMISRGALGNPWIFQEILEERRILPTLEEWLEVIMRQLQYQEEHYGDHKYAAILTRKYLSWYAKGFPGWKALRSQIQGLNSLEEARELFRNFAKKLPSNLVRYECLNQKWYIQEGYDPKYEMDRKLDRGVGTECM